MMRFIGFKQLVQGVLNISYHVASHLLRYCHDGFDLSPDPDTVLETISPRPSGTTIWTLGEPEQLNYDISIIIAAYNVVDVIVPCLESALTQKTDYSFEVIVIDDGSSDGTEVKLDKFIEGHCNLRVFHQTNRGIAAARNEGMRRARGAFFTFLDGDDMLESTFVQKCMDIQRQTDADCVTCDFSRISDNGNVVNTVVTHSGGETWGRCYRRSLWSNLCFPEGYRYEDSIIKPFVLQCRTAEVHEPLYFYRLRPMSLSRARGIKDIDSFWVTELLVEEAPFHGVNLEDSTFYTFVVEQLSTYIRIRSLDRHVLPVIFASCARLLRKMPQPEEEELSHAPLPVRDARYALIHGCYSLWKLVCHFSWISNALRTDKG